VGSGVNSRLTRIDPRTNESSALLGLPGVADFAVDSKRVWVIEGHRVVGLSPRNGRTLVSIRLAGGPSAFAYGAFIRYGLGCVWIASVNGGGIMRPGQLVKVDPATGRTARFELPAETQDLAFARGRVWAGGFDGVLRAVDPAWGRIVRSYRLGRWPVYGLGAGPAGVWASNGELLVHVDPERGGLTNRIRVPGFSTGAVAVGRYSVFIRDGRDALRRVDPRTGAVSAPIGVGKVRDLAVGFGSLWATAAAMRVTRIDPRHAGVARRRTPWCRVQQLRVTQGDLNGATGAIVGVLVVRNVSTRGCSLVGPARLRVVDRAGHTLPVVVSSGEPVPSDERGRLPRNWPYVEVPPGRRVKVAYWMRNACGLAERARVTFELELPGPGGTLSTPGRLAGRCDIPDELPWIFVEAYEPA
jgi:streptogramin lyase